MPLNLKRTLRKDKYGRYAEQPLGNATFRLTCSDFQWYYPRHFGCSRLISKSLIGGTYANHYVGGCKEVDSVVGSLYRCIPGQLSAFSQANSGRILGSISDQTGGAIAGAFVVRLAGN